MYVYIWNLHKIRYIIFISLILDFQKGYMVAKIYILIESWNK